MSNARVEPPKAVRRNDGSGFIAALEDVFGNVAGETRGSHDMRRDMNDEHVRAGLKFFLGEALWEHQACDKERSIRFPVDHVERNLICDQRIKVLGEGEPKDVVGLSSWTSSLEEVSSSTKRLGEYLPDLLAHGVVSIHVKPNVRVHRPEAVPELSTRVRFVQRVQGLARLTRTTKPRSPRLKLTSRAGGAVVLSRTVVMPARSAAASGSAIGYLATTFTAVGFHVASRIDGAVSFGQYNRIIRMNLDLGVGNQLASLSLPGDSFWK